MKAAEAKAEGIMAKLKKNQKITDKQVMDVLAELGEDWPTQARPNVSRTGKPVPGFCLGAV